ncbi:MAG: 16S rRNA (guanine(527)-N(7))-methyltransferase RsmG [Planctomycetota bacterium]|nr:16S rRNA (guanine(527)-N(7))-methyltransferase RsmG [Planctomycetota bacterium]
MNPPNALWTDLAQRANVTLSPEQHAQLSRYLDLLFEANARMNLTRITDRSAAELQHVADALTLLPYLPPDAHRLTDVGSGGGVPGIPLAIARPDATVLLIESTKKKASFLKSAAASLGLANVLVSDLRAEDVGQGASRESFDVAIARAVATMDWLAEWCLPLVKKGGSMLAMKGPKVAEELPAAAKAIKLLGGGLPIVHPVDLPGTEHRVIVEIPKIGKTDARYPRPATQAKGKPIA